MRYGIFGGSFDPPHEGHRHLARSAQLLLGLDEVIWVTAPDPPHKQRPETPYLHRLAMARLMAGTLPGNSASDVESRLSSPSYTLNTLKALKAEAGPGHEWFLVIGADNWAIFPSWHQSHEVLRESTVAVYPRGRLPLEGLPAGVVKLDLEEMPIESTAIRKALAAGAGLEAAGVPPEIRDYVKSHGLYRQGE